MGAAMEQFERFIVAMPCIIVCSICGLLIVLRMIGGELPATPGFGALGVLITLMYFCVNPPHPWFPVLGVIAVLALMISFPFAEAELEKREQREYDAERLERAYGAIQQKADNWSAHFEAARWLRIHGFHRDAILIAENALNQLGTQRDEVKNMSMRDAFRAEEDMVRRWKRETPVPEPPQARQCPACKKVNETGSLLCSGCGRPYHLDKAKLARFKDKVYVKLILTYAAVAALILGGGGIGMAIEGNMRYVAIGAAVVVAGLVLTWLFKPPKASDV
jgi:hypothetical protein